MKVEQKSEVTGTQPQRRMPLYRQPIFVIAILLVIGAVVAGIVLLTRKETAEELSDAEDPPAPVIESDQESGDKTVVQYEGEDPNGLEELTGVVTYAGVENSNLVISTMIDQYIAGGGNCELTLMNDDSDDVYTASVDAFADITTSYCEDFAVPTSELKQGKYQIKIVVTGENKEGTIESEVNI